MTGTESVTGDADEGSKTALAIGNTAVDEFYRDGVVETTRPGGTAFNVASWFRHHGLRASMCSMLGSDFPEIRGIDTSLCAVVDAPSPRCEVFLNDSNVPEGRRWVEGTFGARQLGPVDRRFGVVLLTSGRSEYATPFRTAGASIKGFSLDPMVEAYPADQLRAHLSETDYLHMNRDERRALEATLDERVENLPVTFALQAAIETGADRVVVYEPNGSVSEMRFEPMENPVDTTGAGDAFAAMFLSERVTGASTDAALRSAHEAAKRTITTVGAHPVVDT